MRTWTKKASIFIAAALAYLVGQYFRGVWLAGAAIRPFCRSYLENGRIYCNSPYYDTWGLPLIVLGKFLGAIGLVLLFANERGWRAWLKFSAFYIPIATALILWIYPYRFSLFMLGDQTVEYASGVSRAGWLYLFATIGIVIWTRIRSGK